MLMFYSCQRADGIWTFTALSNLSEGQRLGCLISIFGEKPKRLKKKNQKLK